MAFHIDSNVLPRIPNYSRAKELFNELTPIRGGDQSVRRIGRRSDATKWLQLEIRDGVEVYVAGFHRSSIIEYYPTHYNLSMRGWDTFSTKLFIEALTGNSCTAVKAKDYVPRGFEASLDADMLYDNKPIHTSGEYKFDYDDNPLEELPVLVKYKVNRKRMNEVRKVAKPFFTYIDTMHNLMYQMTELASDFDYWRSEYRTQETVLRDLQEESMWWDMFQSIAIMTQRRQYDIAKHHYVYLRSPKAMKDWVDEALKSRNPQVLDVV